MMIRFLLRIVLLAIPLALGAVLAGGCCNCDKEPDRCNRDGVSDSSSTASDILKIRSKVSKYTKIPTAERTKLLGMLDEAKSAAEKEQYELVQKNMEAYAAAMVVVVTPLPPPADCQATCARKLQADLGKCAYNEACVRMAIKNYIKCINNCKPFVVS